MDALVDAAHIEARKRKRQDQKTECERARRRRKKEEGEAMAKNVIEQQEFIEKLRKEVEEFDLKEKKWKMKVEKLEMKVMKLKSEVGELTKNLREAEKKVVEFEEKERSVHDTRDYHLRHAQRAKDFLNQKRRMEKKKQGAEEEEGDGAEMSQEEVVLPKLNPDDFSDVEYRKIFVVLSKIYQFFGTQKSEALTKLSVIMQLSSRTLLRWSEKFRTIADVSGKKSGGGPRPLMADEEIARDAREWCQKNSRKGFTAQEFCNDFLLKRADVEACKVETARSYLHLIGYRYGNLKSGLYMDGHERPDVIEYRKTFCQKILEHMKDKATVFISQDESIYYAKEGVTRKWRDDRSGTEKKKKGMGKGVMVSGWFDEFGVLTLTDQQWREAQRRFPGIPKSALFYLRFGKNDKGYYTWEKFRIHLMWANLIASVKYPEKKRIFLYDHSSVHKTRGDDALNASRMNKSPGGKQPLMRNTVWNGVVQTMVFPLDHPTYPGQAKGAAVVASERGFSVEKKLLDEIIKLLESCADFRNEIGLLEKDTEAYGGAAMFFPKFHCEFNSCELVWANSKRFCRSNCGGTIDSLEALIPRSFEWITLETYRRIHQHALEEIRVAAEEKGEKISKHMKKMYRSHRPAVGELPWRHLLQNA